MYVSRLLSRNQRTIIDYSVPRNQRTIIDYSVPRNQRTILHYPVPRNQRTILHYPVSRKFQNSKLKKPRTIFAMNVNRNIGYVSIFL